MKWILMVIMLAPNDPHVIIHQMPSKHSCLQVAARLELDGVVDGNGVRVLCVNSTGAKT